MGALFRQVQMAVLIGGALGIGEEKFAWGDEGEKGRGEIRAEIPLDLEWRAPPECPNGEAVKNGVAAILKGRAKGGNKVKARGGVKRLDTRLYHLYITIGEGGGRTRTMEGENCKRLTDAAELILALDIDPEALSGEESEDDGNENLGENRRGNTSESEGEERWREKARPYRSIFLSPPIAPRVRLELGLRVVADIGSLPKVAPGGGASIGISYGHFYSELLGNYWFSQQTTLGPREGAGADIGLMTLGLRTCYRGEAASMGADFCVGAELGDLRARGVGIQTPVTSHSAWVAALAGFAWHPWARLRFSPWIGVDVGGPISSAEVTIEGFGRTYSPAPLFVRPSLGINARLF